MSFRGHYEHSLDSKNRLNIPARFRPAFGNGLGLAKWLDPCVAVFTPSGFDEFNDSFVTGLHPLSQQRRDLTRFFSGGSFDAELDSAGRVTLNAQLIEFAQLGKEVVVVGNRDHLEIWDKTRWADDQDRLAPRVSDIAEGIGNPS
jgi:MraZ protein